ncbi:MAG TPA: M28 family metallopeptidase [Planctomycetaceae bacterium]|jgi:Zn-dependent M28 family amino/carboxypeptidase|nr:M28 family metallopeptidase [Planctomycetaceae bacterium]
MANASPSIPDANPRRLAERLRTHVDRLAGLIGPRHLGKPVALEAAATYIEREFQAFGASVERQWYETQGQLTCNLVIERVGTKRPNQIVILGAHYDTVSITPGADDNASAVAVLIETARVLCQTSFRRTVRFVAFTCEEPPHFNIGTMGSQVYARACRERNDQILGMLCLEMVGYFTTAENSQQLPPTLPKRLRWLFPRRGDFLAAAGNLRSCRLAWAFRREFKRAVRFPLFSMVFPESINEIRLSDNSSFWDQGYPALMLTDTSFLRNPHYHQPTDTPETLDYDRMAQVTLGVAGALKRLARS